jgi:hypothetical protein
LLRNWFKNNTLQDGTKINKLMSTADMPDARAVRAASVTQTETANLHRFLAALRGTWRIPCLAAAFALILGVAALGVLRALLPATTTFIAQFHFTFPSAEAGRYPNGVAFSINELLDPAILAAVYRELDVAQYGLDQERFYGGFSIRPFALTESEAAERVRRQLLDRRLSFVERERLEQQLRSQLDRESRGGAELQQF